MIDDEGEAPRLLAFDGPTAGSQPFIAKGTELLCAEPIHGEVAVVCADVAGGGRGGRHRRRSRELVTGERIGVILVRHAGQVQASLHDEWRLDLLHREASFQRLLGLSADHPIAGVSHDEVDADVTDVFFTDNVIGH